MPKLTFLPSAKTVDVAAGTELLDAARLADITIDAPCGGKGTCGKCIVRIVSGKVDSDNLRTLSLAAVNQGYCLACRTKILDQDVTIEIPEQSVKEGGQFIDETDDTGLHRDRLLKAAQPLKPLTRKIVIKVPQPQLEDGLSDLDRLSRTLQKEIGLREIHFPLPVIRQIAETLRRGDWLVTLSIAEPIARVIRIEAGDCTHIQYGVAIDIGTTTVAVQLVDLLSGRVLATQTDYNKQIDCGLDVISRINYSLRGDRLEELRTRVVKTINRIIGKLCSGNQVNPKEITSAIVAGNTTMVHLFLALPPEHIRLEPYTPTLLESPLFNAHETGISIYPQAPVLIAPSVGSYVGGDITAGLLCTDIANNSESIHLFIDIGTNGELVIGNDDFLMTCACSAGPAFEGGGIEKGMRAAMGAIEKVDIHPQTGQATYQTIGNVPAKGICGSGMIFLLAGLFQTGWLDAAGKLNRGKPCKSIEINGRQARYIIVPPDQAANGEAIYITEIDIDNIIRAKASIYAACALMLDQVGLTFNELETIYIAGGFGRFLDIEKAVTIGLLPDLDRDRFRYIGNSSLMGAYLMLVSNRHRDLNLQLSRRMTYVELSTDPAYMDQFTGASFLPHTDAWRFPSIEKKIRSFATD